jgi:hypothetical protein
MTRILYLFLSQPILQSTQQNLKYTEGTQLEAQHWAIYVRYIYTPTKAKHHLTCFNNIFSNNELISNRFAVFVTYTHILNYLWNRLLIDFYKRCISRTMMEWLTLKWSATLLWLKPPLCMPTACHLSGMVNFRRTIPNQ